MDRRPMYAQVRLLTPSTLVSQKGDGEMELMPPSIFVNQATKTANAPWRELQKITQEIAELKKENERLSGILCLKEGEEKVVAKVEREAHVKQNNLTPNLHFVTAPSGTRYLEDLIQRQVVEIQQLRGELQQMRVDHAAAVQEAEKRATMAEDSRRSDVVRMERELSEKELTYQHKFQTIHTERDAEVSELESVVAGLRDRLCTTETDRDTQTSALRDRLDLVTREAGERVQLLQAQLQSQRELSDSLGDQVTKLKTYIGTVDVSPVDVSTRQLKSLRAKHETEVRKNDNLRSTLDMTNVRLSSLLEIQNIQESHFGQVKSLDTDSEKMELLLLTRWREKVFALMIQLKSSSITQSNNANHWKDKEIDLQRELEMVRNEARILTHTLSDHEAQLRILTNENQELQQELTTAQQISLCLDDKLTDQTHTMQQLTDATQCMKETFDDTVSRMDQLDHQLKSYGQRISFASGRIDVCKAQFARKEAKLRLEQEGTSRACDVTEDTVIVEDPSTSIRLEEELKKVVEERDRLSEQIKSDWTLIQEHIDRATEQCRREERIKVEEAKREHAKAIIELRQLERRVARDAQQAAARDDDHARLISQLYQQRRDLQAETNITIATLRHEGLLTDASTHRSSPVNLASPRSENLNVTDANPVTVDGNTECDASTDAHSRDDIVGDLRSLSSAVLCDDRDLFSV